MPFRTFSEYVSIREGLLAPDRAPAAGQPRLNATPLTNDQRRKLKVNPVRQPNPVRPVAHVVPPRLNGTTTPGRPPD